MNNLISPLLGKWNALCIFSLSYLILIYTYHSLYLLNHLFQIVPANLCSWMSLLIGQSPHSHNFLRSPLAFRQTLMLLITLFETPSFLGLPWTIHCYVSLYSPLLPVSYLNTSVFFFLYQFTPRVSTGYAECYRSLLNAPHSESSQQQLELGTSPWLTMMRQNFPVN